MVRAAPLSADFKALAERQVSAQLGQMPLGPHGRRLLSEILTSAQVENWLSVIILCATLADVALYEESWFGALEAPEDGFGMGLDWLSRRERERLDWLRHRRNALVHYEGPVDGLLGQADDARILAADAAKAARALVPVLDGLEQF